MLRHYAGCGLDGTSARHSKENARLQLLQRIPNGNEEKKTSAAEHEKHNLPALTENPGARVGIEKLKIRGCQLLKRILVWKPDTPPDTEKRDTRGKKINTKILELDESSLARTSFCAFPPDSILALVLGKAPKILKDIESPLVVLKAAMYTEEIKKDILENINPNTRFILW